MRKYGGPGRMKQSCIARQCIVVSVPFTLNIIKTAGAHASLCLLIFALSLSLTKLLPGNVDFSV